MQLIFADKKSAFIRQIRVICVPFFFYFSFSFSQNISGVVRDSASFNHPIFLWETIGNHSYKIDSVKISSEGNFYFPSKNLPTGFYFLSLNDTNRADLILSSSEKKVELEFSEKQLQNGVKIISSEENKILWEYKLISKSVYMEQKNIYILKSYISIPPENARDSALLLQLQFLEDSLNNYKLMELKKICEKNPNTFFAKTARAGMRKKYDSKEEEKKYFFETVDFADAALIRSSVFPNNIMEYLQKFTEYNEAGFKSSVDTILQLAKANAEVYEFCLNYLLEVFDRVGPDVIFQYLIEKYFIGEGCSELNVSENFRKKAESYRILLPGNKAPDFFLKDISGNEKNIYSILEKNKITVLFFWSSQCHFCHNAISELKNIYAGFHSKGLEIIGFSLDENKTNWEKYIQENQLNWLNFSELKGWKSEAVEKFKIHKTPSFYILNNQMVILSKPSTVENLITDVEKLMR